MRIFTQESEIQTVENECLALVDAGDSKFSSMSYEQGILACLEWLLQADGPNPIDD